MKNSLKEKLNSYIRVNGQVSYNTIKDLVEIGFFQKKYRMSTAERRLRESESPEVEAIVEGGAIKYYKWVGAPLKYQTFKVEGENKFVKILVK